MDSELQLDFKLAQREEADVKMKEYLVRTIEGFFSGYPREKVLSLVLTGGMSRAEGSCELTDGKPFIYSDYDLLVVLGSDKDLVEARSKFPMLAREVTDNLRGEEFCSHVDFAPITSNYFEKMKPSMFNVELAEHGKIVWGDSSLISKMSRLGAGQIPVDDALILLFNRIAAQLSMVESLRKPGTSDFMFAFYHNGKIFLDIVSSILVLEHRYRPTYAERLSAITGSSDRFVSRLPGLIEEASFWTDYKLDPNTSTVCERYSSENTLLDRPAAAIHIFNLLIPKMRETLIMCLEETFSVRGVSLRSALPACLRRKGVLQRLREYRSFARRFRPLFKKGRIRRFPAFLKGAPLEMAYASAAMLLFSVDKLGADSVKIRDESLVRDSALFLPVEVPLSGDALAWWEELREAATGVWRFIVKGGAY